MWFFFQKTPDMKRKPVAVEEQVAYLELFNQMLSEMLHARYDDMAGGGEGDPWTVPGLGTGKEGVEDRCVRLGDMRSCIMDG